MDRNTYALNKGLQKPLFFKGFKGKYIYWGMGNLVASLLICIILSTTLNFLFGLIGLMIILFGGFAFIASLQRKGLHSKKRLKECLIISSLFTK